MISEWPEDHALIAFRDGLGLFSPKLSKVLSVLKNISNVDISEKTTVTTTGIYFSTLAPVCDERKNYFQVFRKRRHILT